MLVESEFGYERLRIPQHFLATTFDHITALASPACSPATAIAQKEESPVKVRIRELP
jgi:hypothetical protein